MGCWDPASAPGTGSREFLLLVLELVEAIVDSAQAEKFLVGTLLAQASLVEYENAVCMLDGAEPVRDDDGRASGEQPVEGFANQQLRFRIHARSGFVEDQEFGIVREGAREADELPLPYRERSAALGDRRFDSLR